MDTISIAHTQSVAAQHRVNASTSNRGNTLEQSAAVRQATEKEINSSGREFDRKHERNIRKLEKLSAELDQFDLSSLSEQVRRKSSC